MKKFKFIYLSILLILFTLSSCTEEGVLEPEQSTESVSAKKAMTGLQAHYNSDGTLNSENNPTGNIIFDYGFSYEFPISLTYNTDATTTANNHSELVDIVVAMTADVYISNVDYPFTINRLNQDTNAIVQVSVDDESNFNGVVTAARFNNECECEDTDEPVCVEYTSTTPNGGTATEILTFANACEANCDGFEDTDFVTCEEEEGCWDFVYPATITYDGTSREVSNSAEMNTLLAPVTGGAFAVIYPFDVTIDGSTSTIETPNNFSDIGEWDNRCN